MKKSNKLPENFYTEEQLLELEEKYGLKETPELNYDIYYLQRERAFIEFDYLGKIYKGYVCEILDDEIKLLGVKNKIYLEIEVDGEKEAFPLKGIKNMKKII